MVAVMRASTRRLSFWETPARALTHTTESVPMASVHAVRMSRDSHTLRPSSQSTIMRSDPSHPVKRGLRHSAGEMSSESAQALPLSVEQMIMEQPSSALRHQRKHNDAILHHNTCATRSNELRPVTFVRSRRHPFREWFGSPHSIRPLCLPPVGFVTSPTTSFSSKPPSLQHTPS
ncbi:hypothetical protein TcG_11863 [Trypanosoma cruzi]|nr:hypothetical protein TcG_11863 [Trypanosoma cruzi]